MKKLAAWQTVPESDYVPTTQEYITERVISHFNEVLKQVLELWFGGTQTNEQLSTVVIEQHEMVNYFNVIIGGKLIGKISQGWGYKDMDFMQNKITLSVTFEPAALTQNR